MDEYGAWRLRMFGSVRGPIDARKVSRFARPVKICLPFRIAFVVDEQAMSGGQSGERIGGAMLAY